MDIHAPKTRINQGGVIKIGEGVERNKYNSSASTIMSVQLERCIDQRHSLKACRRPPTANNLIARFEQVPTIVARTRVAPSSRENG